MNKYYYDLHIHSCLSPCADNDSTPGNIAGMGVLNGLDIMALTDHNSAKNCPAFYKAAKRNGIIPIAGMELTTAEDIHVVCLFQTLEGAMEFDRAVSNRRIPVPNRPDIFGDQLICDENDEVVSREENLLINATSISLEEAFEMVSRHKGICYPAHIDRESNGILAVLGGFPESPDYSCVELYDPESSERLIREHKLEGKRLIVSSDAHYLWDIKEKREYFELDDEPYSSDLVRRRLFEYLRQEVKA